MTMVNLTIQHHKVFLQSTLIQVRNFVSIFFFSGTQHVYRMTTLVLWKSIVQ